MCRFVSLLAQSIYLCVQACEYVNGLYPYLDSELICVHLCILVYYTHTHAHTHTHILLKMYYIQNVLHLLFGFDFRCEVINWFWLLLLLHISKT